MRYYLTPITLNTLQKAARLQDARAAPFTFVWHISSPFMPQLAEPLWSFQRLWSLNLTTDMRLSGTRSMKVINMQVYVDLSWSVI